MKKIFTIVIICISSFGCTRKTLLLENYSHNYPKYWDQYTQSQIKDSIFSDTLAINFRELEGKINNSVRDFYMKKISLLINDLKDDWDKKDSLYPKAKFNAVKVTQVVKGLFKKVRYMNENQVNRLLKVINNPLNFEWSETTFEADVKVEFLQDGKVIAYFLLMEDRSVISHPGEWEDFKKMKFGALYEKPRLELVELFGELGFRVFKKKL